MAISNFRGTNLRFNKERYDNISIQEVFDFYNALIAAFNNLTPQDIKVLTTDAIYIDGLKMLSATAKSTYPNSYYNNLINNINKDLNNC